MDAAKRSLASPVPIGMSVYPCKSTEGALQPVLLARLQCSAQQHVDVFIVIDDGLLHMRNGGLR